MSGQEGGQPVADGPETGAAVPVVPASGAPAIYAVPDSKFVAMVWAGAIIFVSLLLTLLVLCGMAYAAEEDSKMSDAIDTGLEIVKVLGLALVSGMFGMAVGRGAGGD